MSSKPEYWHGFVLGNHVTSLNRLTATRESEPSDKTEYNLIGIIKDGDNFHCGFINNPELFDCKSQNPFFESVKRRLSLSTQSSKKDTVTNTIKQLLNYSNDYFAEKGALKTEIGNYITSSSTKNNVLNVLLYIIDVFSFFVFETFFNTPNENTMSSKIEMLKRMSSILVSNPNPFKNELDETDTKINEILKKTKMIDAVNIVNINNIAALINKIQGTSLLDFLLTSKKNVLTSMGNTGSKATSTNKTDENKELNALYETLSKITKQHPFKSCNSTKKIINPNEFYTRNILLLDEKNVLVGQEIGVGNVKVLLTIFANFQYEPNNPETIKPINTGTTPTPTLSPYLYKIKTTETPYYLSTEMQKNGISNNRKMFIIAIPTTDINQFIYETDSKGANQTKTSKLFDKEALKKYLNPKYNSNSNPRSKIKPILFVTSITISQNQKGGDPDAEDLDIPEEQKGGEVLPINIITSRKNKTLRMLKNVRRLESW